MAMPGINPYAIQMQQLQRRQALADALMQQSQQPLDTQFTGGQTSVAVRRSPFESLAKIAQAGAGAYIQNKNDQKYQDIATQMGAAQHAILAGTPGDSGYPSSPTTAPAGSSGAAPTSGTPSDAGVPPAPSANAPTQQNLPPALLTNPGYSPPPPPPAIPAPQPAAPQGGGFGGPTLPQILDWSQNAINYGIDPKVVEIAASARAPTPEMRNIAAVYGNSPQARAALERTVNPAVATNANSPLARFNPATGQYETAYAPPDISKGIAPVITNGQITGVTKLPGSEEVNAGQAAATTAATQANTPKWIDDPLHPGQGRYIYPTPPAYAGGVNDVGSIGRQPRQTIPTPAGAVPATTVGSGPNATPAPARVPTAADLEGQKVGAKTGQDYAADITAKAADAMAGKRTLSEMTNLLQGFTPGAGAPILTKLGAAAQAMGADPATVQKLTSINPGDAEAFQKGTAALAGEAAKQVTNRVTQTEFKVFLANNPNWMMTPNGIKRVMDFMGKGFDQQIDMQQQFADWSKGAPPDRWGIDFPAEYNKRQLAAISAGKTNSAPAPFTATKTSTDIANSAGAPVALKSKADYDALPSGKNIKFVGPDGITYVKP
jgi:hypothetical protein